jgi:hypothetical protein
MKRWFAGLANLRAAWAQCAGLAQCSGRAGRAAARRMAGLLTLGLLAPCLTLLGGWSLAAAQDYHTESPAPLAEAQPAESLSQKSQGEEAHREEAQRAVRLLREKCWNCHGAEQAEGALRLDEREFLLAGGERGPAVELDSAADSLLVRSIAGLEAGLEMPPKDPLAASEVALLQRWLAGGALWPEPADNPVAERRIGNAWEDPANPIRRKFGEERIELWSLKPVVRPPLPVPDPADTWVRNPIDALVAARWREAGLSAAPEADRATLLRRLSYDLTGLPPSRQQVAALLDDAAPDAVERVIERLLAAPAYGQHFARLWLDVVRYSDSNGFDWDEFRPQAWRYRDYVIRAWNADKPFDQFVAEQLAGDLLQTSPPRTPAEQDRLIATGYLRLGPHDNAAPLFNEQDRSRAELLADLTETTGSAFLGLTLSCCRCHDHKTDPLSHEDHYRLRAFFAGVEFADDLPLDLQPEQERIRAQHAGLEGRVAELQRELDAVGDQDAARTEELKKQRDALAASKLPFTTGLLMREKAEARPATFVFFQGDHRAPRQQVEPGFPAVLDPNPIRLDAIPVSEDAAEEAGASANSARLRVQLAQWIASAENPWTARVLVNRLWQAHFGEGLVATPNDFGMTGAAPAHPELLDWLAAEFVESGWSIKHIQRLIVTSHVYRQVSLPQGRAVEPNPEVVPNREEQSNPDAGMRVLVSLRTRLRRLTAEQTRDAVLAVSGLLQQTAGGPPVWPELPPEILQANPAFLDDNATKTKGWYPSPAERQSVRSIFLVQKRTVAIPLLETFDLPENSVSCARRETSIVAPQALALLNSPLAEEAARALEERVGFMVGAESPSPAGDRDAAVAVRALFDCCLLREPTAEELALALEFLRTRTLAELGRALFNTNEFAFVP